jgi:hypothetical protein
VPLAPALCKTFLLRILTTVEQAKTQLRVVVPIEEVEEELCILLHRNKKVVSNAILLFSTNKMKFHVESHVSLPDYQQYITPSLYLPPIFRDGRSRITCCRREGAGPWGTVPLTPG